LRRNAFKYKLKRKKIGLRRFREFRTQLKKSIKKSLRIGKKRRRKQPGQ
jgi:hypothetical protein